MLRTDKPIERIMEDGRCNSVLALWTEDIWGDDNHYIGRWIISNTAYYNAHADEFEGWYPMEDMVIPERLRKPTEKTNE